MSNDILKSSLYMIQLFKNFQKKILNAYYFTYDNNEKISLCALLFEYTFHRETLNTCGIWYRI